MNDFRDWLRTLVGRLSVTLLLILSCAFVGAGVGVLVLVRHELLANLDAQLIAAADRYSSYQRASTVSDDDQDNRAGAGVGQVAGTWLRAADGNCVWVSGDGDLKPAPEVTWQLPQGVPTTREFEGRGEYRVVAQDGVMVGLPEEPTDRSILAAMAGGGLILLTIAGLAVIAAIGSLRRQTRPLIVLAGEAVSVRRELRRGDPLTIVSPLTTNVPSEVRELRDALGALVAEVDGALAARDRSERRLREFMADASHELRTPLALLRAHSDLLRGYSTGAVTPEVEESLQQIDAEAQRMSRLVDDLLMLVRLDQDPHVVNDPVDLTLIVLETVDGARLLAPDHRWSVELPEEPVEVSGDQEQLRRLISNLVTNAWVHTPAGTAVQVRLSGEGAFEVRDDGPGWPEAVLSTEPERFVRGRNRGARGGSGLGLAISSAIVQTHRGTLTLTRGQTGGATARVTLPAVSRAQTGRHDDPAESQ